MSARLEQQRPPRILTTHQTASPATTATKATSINVSNMGGTVALGQRACKAFGPSFPTRVALALYHACRRFPGGITEAATRIEMSSDVLQKKLSPTCDTHNLTMDEAERITLATQDPAGAIELARAAGLICLPMPTVNAGSLSRSLSELVKEFSDVLAANAAAMADNLISENDCAEVDRQFVDVQIAYAHHIAHMRAMAATREPVIGRAP